MTLCGQTTSGAVVSADGYLQVASTLDEPVFAGNEPMPAFSLGTALAPYWNDLRTDRVGGGIVTQVSGSPGGRQLILQWERVVHGLETPVQAEVVFHEGSTALELRCGAVSAGGDTASIGIQRDPAVGLSDSYVETSLSDGLAVAFTQLPITSVISLVADQPATVFGGPGTVTATVSSAGDATGFPTGTVQFSTGDTPTGAAVPLDATGTARLATDDIPAGAPPVTARYSGDAGHSARTAGLQLTIRPDPPLRGGRQEGDLRDQRRPRLRCRAAHRAPGGHPLREVCLPSGQSFLGSCQAVRTVVVTQAAARMPVTSSADPSSSGDPVTLTAGINPRPVTGTVTWTLDGVQQGDPVAVHGGTAALAVAVSGAGAQTVVAIWSGDLKVAAGSASLTRTVS